MSNTLKGALIIGQSGGPTSVINASAYGVIRTALDSPDITAVYGAAHGIKGVSMTSCTTWVKRMPKNWSCCSIPLPPG